MTIRSTKPDVLTLYGDALRALPGVTEVSSSNDGLHLATRSERDSKFLDSLLEDTLHGMAVHFDAPPAEPKAPGQPKPEGKKQPKPRRKKPASGEKKDRPELSPAQKAIKRYGKTLGGIPHVTSVTAGADGSIIVGVDNKKSIGFVDDLVEDKLNGVLVQFQVAA